MKGYAGDPGDMVGIMCSFEKVDEEREGERLWWLYIPFSSIYNRGVYIDGMKGMNW